MNNKFITTFSILILVLMVFYSVVGNDSLQDVEAGTGGSMSGYAWSSNIGWVNFLGSGEESECVSVAGGVWADWRPPCVSGRSCPQLCYDQLDSNEACNSVVVGESCSVGETLKCAAVPARSGCHFIGYECVESGVPVEICTPTPFSYGVDIDSTGDFSGYAWSSNIGWIDFAPTTGYPEEPNHGAKLEELGGAVTGWARALSFGGGWDGWIKMSGEATDGSSYGVNFNNDTKIFEGYAWGDEVVGWLRFNPIDDQGSPTNNPVTGDGIDIIEVVIEAFNDLANVDEGSFVNISVLSDNGFGADNIGGGVTITSVSTPSRGTVINNDPVLQYRNDTYDVAGDRFTYTIDDGLGNTSFADVIVSISPNVCGDGIKQAGEFCDAGLLLNGICQEGQTGCNSDCSGPIDQCESPSVCGNNDCEWNENYFNCPQDCPATFEEF